MSYTVVEHEGVPLIWLCLTKELYDQIASDLQYAHKRREQSRTANRVRCHPIGSTRGGPGAPLKPTALLSPIDFTPGAGGEAVKIV
jgi:hypothetical protein